MSLWASCPHNGQVAGRAAAELVGSLLSQLAPCIHHSACLPPCSVCFPTCHAAAPANEPTNGCCLAP